MKIVIDIPEVYAQTETEFTFIFDITKMNVTYVTMNGSCCEEFECEEFLKTIKDIKAEIRQGVSDFANENGDIAYGFVCAEEIIDKHIADMRESEVQE